MARVTIHKCDRCGDESRDNNNLTEVSVPSAGVREDLCPACIEKLSNFLRFGDRIYRAEVLDTAADIIKENAGSLRGRDAFRLEETLRIISSIVGEE